MTRPSTSDHRPWTIAQLVRYSHHVRIIGIDLGERRIGIAVSDPSATLARPLKTIERTASDAAAVEDLRTTIEELDAEDKIGRVVVGLPLRLNGTANPQTSRVRTMIDMLSSQLNVPVVTQDERLSSHEAEARLSVNEKDWRRRKERLDAAAAAVILQDYLDALALTERRVTSEAPEESPEPKNPRNVQ
jgi:putative holliday junction resolvase